MSDLPAVLHAPDWMACIDAECFEEAEGFVVVLDIREVTPPGEPDPPAPHGFVFACMPPEQARDLARVLCEAADAAEEAGT